MMVPVLDSFGPGQYQGDAGLSTSAAGLYGETEQSLGAGLERAWHDICAILLQ